MLCLPPAIPVKLQDRGFTPELRIPVPGNCLQRYRQKSGISNSGRDFAGHPLMLPAKNKIEDNDNL
jgi:hypothetical protein